MIESERKEIQKRLCKEYYELTGYRAVMYEGFSMNTGTRKRVLKNHMISIASEFFETPAADIVSQSRVTNLIEVRQMVTRILRIHNFTMVEIATMLGYKNHSNVVNTIKKDEGYRNVNKEYRQQSQLFKDYCYKRAREIHEDKEGMRDNYVVTPDKVREIRSIDGKSLQEIATQYKISKGAVWQIVNNKTWKHIN